MKVNITKVFSTDKKKDGTALINKYGKTYFRVGLQTREYGETWVNGFTSFDPAKWVNTEQELEITDGEYNGKPQKSFTLPNKETELNKAIMRHESEIGKLWDAIHTLQGKQKLDIPVIQEDELNKDLAGMSLPDSELPF